MQYAEDGRSPYREVIMLLVESVNGCNYCDYGWVGGGGVSEEEREGCKRLEPLTVLPAYCWLVSYHTKVTLLILS